MKIGIIATQAEDGMLRELRYDILPATSNEECYAVLRGSEVGLFASK